jgi:ribosome-binding protein aMBF1 (putative translation factor)
MVGEGAVGHAKVTLTIDGKEYVAIPRAEYLRIVGGKDLEGAVDAGEYTRRRLGETLRAARDVAGLTQEELAKKLGKKQPMVSGAESGSVRVGERYVAAVLKACGLPKNWKAPKKKGTA